jgi:hypothetical protein
LAEAVGATRLLTKASSAERTAEKVHAILSNAARQHVRRSDPAETDRN